MPEDKNRPGHMAKMPSHMDPIEAPLLDAMKRHMEPIKTPLLDAGKRREEQKVMDIPKAVEPKPLELPAGLADAIVNKVLQRISMQGEGEIAAFATAPGVFRIRRNAPLEVKAEPIVVPEPFQGPMETPYDFEYDGDETPFEDYWDSEEGLFDDSGIDITSDYDSVNVRPPRVYVKKTSDGLTVYIFHRKQTFDGFGNLAYVGPEVLITPVFSILNAPGADSELIYTSGTNPIIAYVRGLISGDEDLLTVEVDGDNVKLTPVPAEDYLATLPNPTSIYTLGNGHTADTAATDYFDLTEAGKGKDLSNVNLSPTYDGAKSSLIRLVDYSAGTSTLTDSNGDTVVLDILQRHIYVREIKVDFNGRVIRISPEGSSPYTIIVYNGPLDP